LRKSTFEKNLYFYSSEASDSFLIPKVDQWESTRCLSVWWHISR
jgi:hypothetical protein